jgi:hypothetical protein
MREDLALHLVVSLGDLPIIPNLLLVVVGHGDEHLWGKVASGEDGANDISILDVEDLKIRGSGEVRETVPLTNSNDTGEFQM